MKAFAFVRHPFTLLVAVSAVIGFIWYVLGAPVQMPRSPLPAGEKLGCVSYAPVSPEAGEISAEIPLSRIEADLASLAPYASCVRTYRTGAGLERVAEVARRHGLAVLQGVAIGTSDAEDRAEIERAVALAVSQRSAIRAFIVGSEVLARGSLSADELARLLQEVRERTKLPVSYADRSDIWLGADVVAANVDFITIHVPLYDAAHPVAAGDAARHVAAVHAKMSARFPARAIAIGEAGWPSAGRMREAALPSPSNQARVLHELVAAAKAGKFQLGIFEGIDRDWSGRTERPSATHWGLLHSDTREAKFRWGAAVNDHPLWFEQAATGILLSFVVFAAGFLAARSFGVKAAAAASWEPVAIIALAGGAVIGWAIEDLPVQSTNIADWVSGTFILTLAFFVPPVVAAAVVRRVPFEGFSAVLDSRARRATNSLAFSAAFLFVLVVIFAVQSSLALAFDPDGREFPYAALTGPALALLVLSVTNAPGARRESFAEAASALTLVGAAGLIVFNEWILNWQALWFAALLVALAAACWRAPGVQKR